MTKDEFKAAVRLQRIRSQKLINACRHVLVDALTPAEASRRTKLDKAQISRALARLRSNVCPCCKRPL